MPRVRTGDVQIKGLNEVNKALKELGKEARKELRDVSKQAADLVASDAQAGAYTIGGVAAHVAPSIKPAASLSGSAGVSIGGSGYEMAGGAEFGALKYTQFQPWRGASSDAGYFLYPAIRKDIDQVVDLYAHGLDQIIKRRFPE